MKNAPKILIQDEEAGEIFEYFADDLNYSQKYAKANKFELGDHVQGENVTGTALNLDESPSAS